MDPIREYHSTKSASNYKGKSKWVNIAKKKQIKVYKSRKDYRASHPCMIIRNII
jgi:hypothetical protein